MTKYQNYSRPATDVYSRKHIDKQIDRLERLREHDKAKIKRLQSEINHIMGFLEIGPYSKAFALYNEQEKKS